MQAQKAQKIDFTTEYPCPCRRRGRLVPITLTEAFGCDRCQQIFVVEDNGYALEQLSTTYPYKQSWRWSGHQWYRVHSVFREGYLPLALGSILVLLIVWLPLALQSSIGPGILAWAAISVLLTMLPALMMWLAYRR